MKQLILTFGGSYVRYKWESWTKYIDWFTECEVINHGVSACANETIWKRTIAECLAVLDRKPMVYVMWSPVDRYEVVTDKDYNPSIGKKITFPYIDPKFDYKIWTGGHFDPKVKEYLIKHLVNERQNFTRTLFYMFDLQNFFKVFDLDYRMMLWSGSMLENSFDSEINSVLLDKIDFSKFIFYKQKQGLKEFTDELYPEHISTDNHPLPYAHYQWTKQVIFESDVECPEEEKNKLLDRSLQIKNDQK